MGEHRGDGRSADAPVVDHRARRSRVRAALAAHDLDIMLVSSRTNVRWLTGFTGSNATLLLGPPDAQDPAAVLATDGRYVTQAHAQVAGLGEDIELVTTRTAQWLPAAVRARRLGVEADHLTFATARLLQEQDPDLQLCPVDGVVEDLRARKDAAETALLARACRITADAFTAMYGWLASGMTERAVAHRLLGEMIARGADGASFDFIVAAGVNGAEPHHAPTTDLLAPGDLVTVDAGALVGGYHADMTRTVALGPASHRLREVHDVVADAQRQGVAACRAGTPAAHVDAVCRGAIAAAGHAGHFVHPTGHGVGLDIHEEPILHERQEATLRSGMAVTVEPGIYIPGLGGVRIEDVVAVGTGPPRVLTGADAGAGPATGPDSHPPGATAAYGPLPPAHELIEV